MIINVDEIISTRRNIISLIIAVCTNRFDDDTKTSFVDLYSKVSILSRPNSC